MEKEFGSPAEAAVQNGVGVVSGVVLDSGQWLRQFSGRRSVKDTR